MDIRTKLALALVSVSLLSMLVLGAVTYSTASGLLRQVSERQLDALAESKQRDLEKVILGWEDRVRLIRSRTRLRALLARTARARDEAALAEMRRILEDAVESVASFDRITLFDQEGDPVVSVGSQEAPIELDPVVFEQPTAVLYGGVSVLGSDRVGVRFYSAMQVDDRTVGAIEAIIDAEDLLTVTQDFTGLGETGESLVVVRDVDERALVLTPLRHDSTLRHLILDSTPYVSSALSGQEALFREGVTDYRGADVWCATRTLASVGWGLIVKIDSAEESLRADALLDQMIDLGLALGALAILGGTILGFRLGQGLWDLKEVVERIRAGETSARADPATPDEVGFLAAALNDLLDEQQKD